MYAIDKNKSLNILVLVYFILLPIFFFSTTIDPFLLPRQLLTNTLLFLILVILIRNNTSTSIFIIDKTTLLFLGFIVFCGISFSQSKIASISHATFSKYLTFFLFFLTIKHLINNNLIRKKQVYTNVILFGVLSILITLLIFAIKQFEGHNIIKKIDFFSGTFGNKNFLTSILFMCLPFYLIGLSISKKIKAISIFAIIITILLLFILRTRTVLIALFLFTIVLLIYHSKTIFSRKTLITSITAMGILISGLFSYFIIESKTTHSASYLAKYYLKSVTSSSTLYFRLEYWQQAIYIIKDEFFNGVGVGSWISTYPKYGLNQFSNTAIQNGKLIINNTHNDFLQVFLEIGVFGFLCYIGLFVTILYQAYWLSKYEQKSCDRKNAAYFFIFILCYLIIACFDFPLARIEHQIVLIIVFSIINSKYVMVKASKTIKINSSYVYLFCFITLVYSSIVLLYRINGDKHLLKALNEQKKGNTDTFILEVNNAKNPFFTTDNFAIPLEWHLGKTYFNNGSFEESLYYFKESYIINPFSIVVNNDLASCYIKNNKITEALKHYKEALMISPNYIDARLNLAATYFNLKQYDNAFETIDKCEEDLDNAFYNEIIIPIVEKKLNITLLKLNNQNLNIFLQSKITSENDLKSFYYEYKKYNTTFDLYIHSLIN